MPKRSERELYGDAFEGNPFEGADPLDMYGELQWDKDPEAVWEVDAPEPIVAIGDLAGFEWDDDELELYHEDDAPFLAVGRDRESNREEGYAGEPKHRFFLAV